MINKIIKINRVSARDGYATVALMVFVVIGLTITAAATTIIMINALAASRIQQGIVVHGVAESGMENGIIRFLRDPVDYSGETITTESGTAVITVSGDRRFITSVGTSGNYKRTIQAQVDYSDNLKIMSWKEVY
jgi:hypothetical protein